MDAELVQAALRLVTIADAIAASGAGDQFGDLREALREIEMSLDVYLYIEIDTGGSEPHHVDLYDANITHNLSAMADAAGIYYALWRPSEMLDRDAARVADDADEEARQLWEADPDRAEQLRQKAAAIRAQLPQPFARDLIDPLERGLASLKADPVGFARYDASNGWGRYENFVPFVEKYLAACREHPKAKVRTCR